VGQAEGQVRVRDDDQLFERAERPARRGQGGGCRAAAAAHADRVRGRRQRRQGGRRLDFAKPFSFCSIQYFICILLPPDTLLFFSCKL
jgi:hypothetical protein